MYKSIPFLFLMTMALFFVTSCGDDPEEEEATELITRVTYTLTSAAGSVTLSFEDSDGDGGNAAVITGGTLAANTSYTGSIDLFDTSGDETEDIGEEVAEEDDEHQFFFSSTVAGVTVAYNDADGDGNPLGLANTVTTGAAGSGTLTVILRHEPDKNADGVSGGDISNAGGETDIEVAFPIEVQ